MKARWEVVHVCSLLPDKVLKQFLFRCSARRWRAWLVAEMGNKTGEEYGIIEIRKAVCK